MGLFRLDFLTVAEELVFCPSMVVRQCTGTARYGVHDTHIRAEYGLSSYPAHASSKSSLGVKT